jgi:hypothetical protein
VSVRGGALVDQRSLTNPMLSKALSCGNTVKVELSGLEPLTSCMPCGSGKSVYVRRRRTRSLLPAPML